MKINKIVAMLIALVTSICLWVYAVTVVNPDDTVNITGIQLRLDGVSELYNRGLMVTGGEKNTVNVKLKGRRSDLKALNRETVVAVVNLSRITEAGEHEVSWSLEFPGSVASGDISIEHRSSATVHLKVSETKEKKDMPIELDYSVTTAPGYWTQADMAALVPQTVTVQGPLEEVGLVEHAVVRLRRTDAEEIIEDNLVLEFLDARNQPVELSEYCRVSAREVNVVLPVYESKEITLEVKLLDGGGATGENTQCRISPAKITVTGDRELLDQLPDTMTIKTIDLADYTGDGIPQIMMSEITERLPEGVVNRSGRETVDIVVEFKGIATKEFLISTQRITLLDETEQLSLEEGEVRITVRGPEEILRGLKSTGIRLTADPEKNYDPETGLVTLTAEIPDYPELGVIGGPYTAGVRAVAAASVPD